MNSLIKFNKIDLFSPIKQWLESLEISQPKIARLLCRIIPASCPFEREIKLLNHTIAYIPPLCKLNPFYDQIVEIRFKCLSYLANECGESAL
ncbi:Mo-dependent nitrogenase C-terminal domain-containing protein [Nostoc sp. UHCC 0302]|uniref:Mo-dependent nitrogenase C-terminal domain-containing protein n=1 Tax=Nostoc sp. UHCC 0302 TaxID=3134896 RepID=UPI00311C8F9B